MADECWPRYGGGIVLTIQLTELTFLASLYIVLSGSLMHSLLPNLPIPQRLWMAIAAFVCLPTLFIKHFSNVAWFSLLSVTALTIAVGIILGYGFSTTHNWEITDIPLWNPNGVPIAIAIVIFSYISHPVLPTIESNMRDPDRFNTMLAITYAFIVSIKVPFALIGFLAFSSNIQDVITNSIPIRGVQLAVNSLLVLNVFFSYPFLVKSIIHCMEDSIASESLQSRLNEWPWFILSRVVVNLVTLLPALVIPHFALMMSFLACLTAMFIAFILPCVFHLYFQSDQLRWYNKGLDYSIIVFGVVTGGVGLVVSWIILVKSF